MANLIPYAAAAAALRSAGHTPGTLVSSSGSVPVGTPAQVTQADLLLGVLSAHSAVVEDQEMPGGGYAGEGLAGFAARDEEEGGGWATWHVRWHTHAESGLHAEFTNGQVTLLYDEEHGAMSPALAGLLNASVWPVLS